MALSTDARNLLIESWILYFFGMVFILARMLSRRILLGSWRKLQIDDYIMLFIICTFTGVIVSVNITAQNLSNYLPPGVEQTFTPQDVDNAIYGSKFVFILEEMQLATLWMCKACLLILYSSMTQGLPKQHRFVKIVGVYCVVGYIVTQVLFLGVWCKPIQQYWQVPVTNSQCASYYHHLVTASVFNISSDLIMLLIPLPLLVKARLPFRHKLVLCGVFSLGLCVILAAILNRYYNFTAGYGSLIYLNWYAGEAATAVMVTNIPHCWPIVSRIFRLGSFQRGGGADSSTNRFHLSSKSVNTSGTHRHNHRRHDEHGYIRSESEEHITNPSSGFGNGGGAMRTSTNNQHTDVELGRLDGTHENNTIGTAVTAGSKFEHTAQKGSVSGLDHGGSIVKTISLNQTYDDEHDMNHRT